MTIQQLTDEQIHSWTLEEKDRWWLANVFRGDMPQLTARAAVTGMLLGGILSLTNLYVGAKTGWTLGVGITSVILAFGMFKVLAGLGMAREFTVLENNCMQSIATAAGYMTGPLISSLAAYMMVTNTIIPMATTIVWITSLSLLGVLFAFPLKRRFINDEQHPFPEGRAAGIVMDALHSGDPGEGLFKAKILTAAAAISAAVKLLTSHDLLERLKLGVLAVPEFLDGWVYRFWSPRLAGTELRELTVRPDTDIVMFGAGGLMGIRTGVSLMVGAVINYCILAPWMIQRGDIEGQLVDGVMHYGFRRITIWGLWGGVAMMTTASLYAFFARPQILVSAFRGLVRRRTSEERSDVLQDIELPLRVFVIGIPVVGAVVVLLAHWFFGVAIWQGIVAIPLIFVFTLIAVNSTALTSITPLSALGKLTQLTYGVLAPRNITTNIATASITAEVASNASNLLMDIKPGYMLGAKPRQQAIGHVLGIFAGALAAVPVYYLLFLKNGPQHLVTDQNPMPSAQVWKAVAELLTQGISELKVSAQWAALVAALLGIALEAVRFATKGRFWLSGVGIGLAAIIPFNTVLAMFLGSLCFWLAERKWSDVTSRWHRIAVQNQEPICAGLIAGGALMGITAMLEEVYGVQVWLLMMTIGATLAYALVLQSVGGPLRSVGAPAPAGILSLEFAWTASRVNQILADWSDRAVRGNAVLSLWLDYGFILVYSATLALIGVVAVETLIPAPVLARHLVMGLFLAGVAAAAICDAVENGLLLWFLYGHPPVQDTLPALASHCARCKFALLIHLAAAALVAWMVGMVLPR
jgi:putative OPT family oligopeptide transporter